MLSNKLGFPGKLKIYRWSGLGVVFSLENLQWASSCNTHIQATASLTVSALQYFFLVSIQRLVYSIADTTTVQYPLSSTTSQYLSSDYSIVYNCIVSALQFYPLVSIQRLVYSIADTIQLYSIRSLILLFSIYLTIFLQYTTVQYPLSGTSSQYLSIDQSIVQQILYNCIVSALYYYYSLVYIQLLVYSIADTIQLYSIRSLVILFSIQ